MTHPVGDPIHQSSAICHLPNEVLAIIFMYCTTDIPTFVDGKRAKGVVTLFRIARVCQYWRTVALSTPELWARPDFSQGQPLALTMLSRSKDAPLIVDLEIAKSTLGVIPEVVKHIHRTVELNLSATEERTNLEELVADLTHRAPLLHTLGLASDLHYARESSGTQLQLPSSFLGGYAPRLKTLVLRRWEIPLQTRLLHNITRLSIDMLTPSSTSDPARFAGSLRAMPFLEILEARNAFQASRLDYFEPMEPVRLSHLRYLRLDGMDCFTIACFLERVAVPPTTSVVVKSHASETEDSSVEFISSLSDMFSREHEPSPAPSIRSLYIGHLYNIYGWDVENLPGPEHPFLPREYNGSMPSNLRVHVGLTVDTSMPIPPLFRGIVTALPNLHQLQALHIEVTEITSTYIPSLEEFIDCFGALPSLQTVRLKGDSAPLLMVAFDEAFPALRTLQLHSVSGQTCNDGKGTVSSRLSKIVTSRKALGFETIRNIMLVQSGSIHQVDVQYVEEIIENVEWDRWEAKNDFGLLVEDPDSLSTSPHRPSIVVN